MTDFKKLAYRQREEFISTVNHDLKIPVIAQIRALELVVNENFGTLNDEQKEILKMTLDSCRSMYKMISGILSAYKYENRDIILDFEYVNLLNILEKCFAKSSDYLIQKGISINVSSKIDKSMVYADKIQLRKAFGYIVNYCISNTISEIQCFIKQVGDSIQAGFIFENPYCSKEKVDNMYNSRLDKVGNSLGLYLAKQIIFAHQGSIEVKILGRKNICLVNLPNVNYMTK